jgi:hypothetical protein
VQGRASIRASRSAADTRASRARAYGETSLVQSTSLAPASAASAGISRSGGPRRTTSPLPRAPSSASSARRQPSMNAVREPDA